MEPSEIFHRQVREAWGNPHQVADAGLNELFRHEEIGLDHDDQVRYATQVGVLAGQMQDRAPDEFITAFAEEALAD